MLAYDIYGKQLYKVDNNAIGYESTLFHTKEYWNKGIGTKFITLALKIAFNKLSMVKVNVGIYGNNRGSEKILIKNGFKREGKLDNYYRFSKSRRVDRILFGITKKEFKLKKN